MCFTTIYLPILYRHVPLNPYKVPDLVHAALASTLKAYHHAHPTRQRLLRLSNDELHFGCVCHLLEEPLLLPPELTHLRAKTSKNGVAPHSLYSVVRNIVQRGTSLAKDITSQHIVLHHRASRHTIHKNTHIKLPYIASYRIP